MPKKPLDERQAEYIRAYVDGKPLPTSTPPRERENTIPGFPPPAPPRMPSSVPPKLERGLEGTHKRMLWLAGICGTLVGAIYFGWNAREAAYNATHYYQTTAAASAEAVRLDDATKRVDKAGTRLDEDEKRLAEHDRLLGELRSIVEHATTPGAKGRKRTFAPLPDAGAPEAGGPPKPLVESPP